MPRKLYLSLSAILATAVIPISYAADERDIAKEKYDVKRDIAKRNQEQREVNADVRTGDLAGAQRELKEVNAENRDIAKDRKEVAGNKKDVSKDRLDSNRDFADLPRDRRGRHKRPHTKK